jgi:hypothetical protein
MNNKFDELTKSMAQAVTRRAAFKKLGLAAVATIAARLGVGGASAAPQKISGYCQVTGQGLGFVTVYTGICVDPTTCQQGTSSHCPSGVPGPTNWQPRFVLDSCTTPPPDYIGGFWLDTSNKYRCSF